MVLLLLGRLEDALADRVMLAHEQVQAGRPSRSEPFPSG
jgi:hypothetical protein